MSKLMRELEEAARRRREKAKSGVEPVLGPHEPPIHEPAIHEPSVRAAGGRPSWRLALLGLVVGLGIGFLAGQKLPIGGKAQVPALASPSALRLDVDAEAFGRRAATADSQGRRPPRGGPSR